MPTETSNEICMGDFLMLVLIVHSFVFEVTFESFRKFCNKG